MADAGERQGEGRRPHRAQRGIDVLGAVFRRLADEPQGDMVVVGLDPARAGDAALQHGERVEQPLGQFETDEQAQHEPGADTGFRREASDRARQAPPAGPPPILSPMLSVMRAAAFWNEFRARWA